MSRRRVAAVPEGQASLFGEPTPRAKPVAPPPVQWPKEARSAGFLVHGQKGGPWWTVEIAGAGVAIVHHSGMRVPIWWDGLEHCKAYVRRSVPELEADAFDELVSGYRPPGMMP